MPVYTVVGWSHAAHLPTLNYLRASDPLPAAVEARQAHAAEGDWQLIVVVAGKHVWAAQARDVIPPSGAPRRRSAGRDYTIIGMWRDSGEAIVMHQRAADGVEALTFVRAGLATAEERLLAGALPGQLPAALRAESLPVYF